MAWFFDPEIWIGLLTLTALEIVLGIDNIVFISILAARLPRSSQNKARLVGLSLALVMRVALLLSLSWIIGLTRPLFVVGHIGVTGRALILLFGGLFLLAKSTREIHHKFDQDDSATVRARAVSFNGVILQIALFDAVFSLDSVITAVGMVDQIGVMIAAVVVAMAVMMIFSGSVTRFIERHPTLKMLALSFLILIGANLIAEGIGIHIPKGYTYFAMGFSLVVELLNIRLHRRRTRKRKR